MPINSPADNEPEQLGKAVAQKMWSDENTSKAWGLNFEDAGAGWARGSIVLREDMMNGHRIAHGGVVFSLADTVFAWACNSANEKTVAQHASITFLNSAVSGEKLIAEARRQASRGRSGVYDVIVSTEDGRTIAIFQGLSRVVGGQMINPEEV